MSDTSSTAVLADTAIREQALDPRRSFIVQAPAGSGKTELLTQRYLRLLAVVETPEQILAITFTRKAASEMRQRVMQALRRASATPRPEKAYEARQWDLARAGLAADAQRGWQLLAHPARLRIHTIDALNASLARRLPVLAGLGASMEIAPDIMPVYERVAARLLEQLGNGTETAQQLEAVLRHLANRVPDFIVMLSRLLARRDHWLGLVMRQRDEAELRAGMERTLQAAIEHHLQWLTDCLSLHLRIELVELAALGAANRLKNGAKPEQAEALLACSQLTAWPAVDHRQLDAWRGLALMICKSDGEFYKTISATQGFPADNKPLKTRMLAALGELSALPGLGEQLKAVHELPAPTFDAAQWQVLRALLGLLPRAVAELLVEFQQRGQIDYVELAQRALQALGSAEQPTDLALALDARLQHVLVDEFQDTSVPQRELLRALLAGWTPDDGRTLFCVGDPMQSIYRFRQAEVGLFLELQTQGLPPVTLTPLRLQTNFRSTQPIVQWVNACFPRVLPPRDDAELGAVSYSASVPQPAADADGRVVIHAAIDRTVAVEAEAVVELVRERLAGTTQRLAILVSNRSHAGPIAVALKRGGIAFNAVDIERLYQRPLVQDLICLTRALLHFGDRTAWLACLRAPWCGLALPDLHVLAGDESETLWTRMNDVAVRDGLSATARQRLQRFLSACAAALATRARTPLRDWVESCWLALGGPAILRSANDLEDAEAFFARLDELQVAGDLEDSARLEIELSELYAAPANAADARVEIMTIHKSKGLEFDVVILPSLHRRGGREEKTLLRWALLRGLPADGLVLAPPAARGDEHDPIYRWLATLEKRRADLERGRLLYVAATRAHRELHVFGSVKLTPKGEPRAPQQGSLLRLLWPQVETDFARAAAVQAVTPLPPPRLQQASLWRLPLDWRMPTAEPALAGYDELEIVNLEQRPEFDWVGETSRHVGTTVHAELERLLRLPPAEMQRWDAVERRAALLLQLTELGVPETLCAAAVERVMDAVRKTLADARGRWILGIGTAHREASSELALSGVIGGRVLNSVIDRSFVDEQGVRWIIDFKTSSHEGGGREEFLHSEMDRYRPQLARYAGLMRAWKPAQPIRTALYFPLLGEWREVSLT